MSIGKSHLNNRLAAAVAAAALLAVAAGARAAGPLPAKEKVAYLGVTTSAVDEVLAAQLNLPRGVGLIVNYVDPAAPAAKAGLLKHDVLHKLGDQLLINTPQLAVLVRLQKPGDKVTLTVIRGGKPQALEIELGGREAADGAAYWPGLEFGGFQLAPGGGGVFQVRPAGPAVRASAHKARVAEDGKVYEIETADEGRRLKVTGPDGKVLYEGPADSPEYLKALPEEIRKKYEYLLKNLAIEQPGEAAGREARTRLRTLAGDGGAGAAVSASAVMGMADGEHQLTIETGEGGRRHLTATDLKTGAVLFKGPINTDAERAAVPEPIRTKLDRLEQQSRIIIHTEIRPALEREAEPPPK